MAYFYNTQKTFNQTGNMMNTSLNFTNNKLGNNLYDTMKSQHTNFTTFQNFNTMNSLKDKNIYNIIKLQYTLVLDFLSKIDMSFTLNTFNNEIKTILNPNTPYKEEEISKIIDINPDTDFQNTLFNKNPFLNTYLYHLIYSKSNLLKIEKEVQTMEEKKEENKNDNNIKINNFFFSSKKTSIDGVTFMKDIDDKLKEIDKKYNNKIKNENLPKKNNITEQYKRELEDKYKEDLKNEIERIKAVEIGKIIIEENQKYLEKIEAIRMEYENKYDLKNKELNQKEKEIKEKQNILDNKYEENRKELLENYQKKILDLNEKESNFKNKCIKELKDIKEKKISLDNKERELFILKKDYYKEMQKEVDKIKNEFKEILKKQIQKIKYEHEKELEKTKNKLRLYKINYDMNENKNNINSEYFKEIYMLKDELANIKLNIEKDNKKNKNKGSILFDKDNEKNNNEFDYYEQLSNIELKLNEIANKIKFKYYNLNKKEEEKNESDRIIKDENIRKKMEELEDEQNDLNKQVEKELNYDVEKELPKAMLTNEEIDNIKNIKYNMVLYDLAKEKELNEIYKRELEEENVKNKIKYINEINQNMKEKIDNEANEHKYIIIDVNEMEKHKNLYLKLYRQRREQQKIDEINKQKEKIRQRELKEKEIREKQIKEREEKEKRQKSKDKDEEKNQFSKSIQLPPVRNPKERKSSAVGDIEELISKSRIRIASSSFIGSPENTKLKKDEKKEEQKEEKIKSSGGSEDDYGSGDFENISSKLDVTKKEKDKNIEKGNEVPEEASLLIDKILNEEKDENISEINGKESSESYNDFETSNALDKKGIKTENSVNDNQNRVDSINSSEDYKF